jgi:hypothetical protein
MMTLMDSTLLADVEGLSSLFTVIASLDGNDLSVSLSFPLSPALLLPNGIGQPILGTM